MWRALMWLKDVQHKLKNGLKTQKNAFLTKHISDFVLLPWNLHNPYCHIDYNVTFQTYFMSYQIVCHSKPIIWNTTYPYLKGNIIDCIVWVLRFYSSIWPKLPFYIKMKKKMLLYTDFSPIVSISYEWENWWASYKHSQTKFMPHWGNQKCFAPIYELFWIVIQSKKCFVENADIILKP